MANTKLSGDIRRVKDVDIRLPRHITQIEKVELWEKMWNEAKYASYTLPENMTEDEIRDYFSLLLPRLPSHFISAILSELAENVSTPWELLPELYEKGDAGCKVSICLRNDIPNEWLEKCLNSSNMDVLEHVVFSKRVPPDKCKELLRKPLEEHIKNTILRAIEYKKSGK